ncbi:hypothetical protein [Caballeronia mineralivorans]|jgi:hypothetical protein|uniref:hypothetical protein n=1 Tax=Caballeronia mineralivorans TaxID=2010198 RepID=UPI0023F58CDE|nr:hypothetical protein [Caballeronia mineralivorans]MDB5786994.1 hypothetical protein [Caballeronia mineralivorans]MEA3098939.1 hypothetical protein [Caballeronia mineralivorans]
MSNSITSAFMNSPGVSDFSQQGGGVNGAGQNSTMAQVLKDIEQLLGGGQDSSGGGGGANGANSNGNSQMGGLDQLLQDLQKLEQGNSGGGQQAGSGVGGGTGGGMPGGVGGDDSGGGGQAGGLRDVKLNTKAGGEALHLQEDANGTLYNGSGNSVGQVNQDGSVSLNSGATKERERLETGGKGGLAGMMTGVHGSEGDGGNVDFSSSEVTVSAGDLNQKNDF